MAETKRAKTIRQAIERTKALKKEYGMTTAPTAGVTTTAPSVGATTVATPKKKKKSTIRSIIEKIRGFLTPKPQKGITPPSGYAGMTEGQKKEWQSIMEQTK